MSSSTASRFNDENFTDDLIPNSPKNTLIKNNMEHSSPLAKLNGMHLQINVNSPTNKEFNPSSTSKPQSLFASPSVKTPPTLLLNDSGSSEEIESEDDIPEEETPEEVEMESEETGAPPMHIVDYLNTLANAPIPDIDTALTKLANHPEVLEATIAFLGTRDENEDLLDCLAAFTPCIHRIYTLACDAGCISDECPATAEDDDTVYPTCGCNAAESSCVHMSAIHCIMYDVFIAIDQLRDCADAAVSSQAAATAELLLQCMGRHAEPTVDPEDADAAASEYVLQDAPEDDNCGPEGPTDGTSDGDVSVNLLLAPMHTSVTGSLGSTSTSIAAELRALDALLDSDDSITAADDYTTNAHNHADVAAPLPCLPTQTAPEMPLSPSGLRPASFSGVTFSPRSASTLSSRAFFPKPQSSPTLTSAPAPTLPSMPTPTLTPAPAPARDPAASMAPLPASATPLLPVSICPASPVTEASFSRAQRLSISLGDHNSPSVARVSADDKYEDDKAVEDKTTNRESAASCGLGIFASPIHVNPENGVAGNLDIPNSPSLVSGVKLTLLHGSFTSEPDELPASISVSTSASAAAVDSIPEPAPRAVTGRRFSVDSATQTDECAPRMVMAQAWSIPLDPLSTSTPTGTPRKPVLRSSLARGHTPSQTPSQTPTRTPTSVGTTRRAARRPSVTDAGVTPSSRPASFARSLSRGTSPQRLNDSLNTSRSRHSSPALSAASAASSLSVSILQNAYVFNDPMARAAGTSSRTHTPTKLQQTSRTQTPTRAVGGARGSAPHTPAQAEARSSAAPSSRTRTRTLVHARTRATPKTGTTTTTTPLSARSTRSYSIASRAQTDARTRTPQQVRGSSPLRRGASPATRTAPAAAVGNAVYYNKSNSTAPAGSAHADLSGYVLSRTLHRVGQQNTRLEQERRGEAVLATNILKLRHRNSMRQGCSLANVMALVEQHVMGGIGKEDVIWNEFLLLKRFLHEEMEKMRQQRVESGAETLGDLTIRQSYRTHTPQLWREYCRLGRLVQRVERGESVVDVAQKLFGAAEDNAVSTVAMKTVVKEEAEGDADAQASANMPEDIAVGMGAAAGPGVDADESTWEVDVSVLPEGWADDVQDREEGAYEEEYGVCSDAEDAEDGKEAKAAGDKEANKASSAHVYEEEVIRQVQAEKEDEKVKSDRQNEEEERELHRTQDEEEDMLGAAVCALTAASTATEHAEEEETGEEDVEADMSTLGAFGKILSGISAKPVSLSPPRHTSGSPSRPQDITATHTTTLADTRVGDSMLRLDGFPSAPFPAKAVDAPAAFGDRGVLARGIPSRASANASGSSSSSSDGAFDINESDIVGIPQIPREHMLLFPTALDSESSDDGLSTMLNTSLGAFHGDALTDESVEEQTRRYHENLRVYRMGKLSRRKDRQHTSCNGLGDSSIDTSQGSLSPPFSPAQLPSAACSAPASPLRAGDSASLEGVRTAVVDVADVGVPAAGTDALGAIAEVPADADTSVLTLPASPPISPRFIAGLCADELPFDPHLSPVRTGAAGKFSPSMGSAAMAATDSPSTAPASFFSDKDESGTSQRALPRFTIRVVDADASVSTQRSPLLECPALLAQQLNAVDTDAHEQDTSQLDATACLPDLSQEALPIAPAAPAEPKALPLPSVDMAATASPRATAALVAPPPLLLPVAEDVPCLRSSLQGRGCNPDIDLMHLPPLAPVTLGAPTTPAAGTRSRAASVLFTPIPFSFTPAASPMPVLAATPTMAAERGAAPLISSTGGMLAETRSGFCTSTLPLLCIPAQHNTSALSSCSREDNHPVSTRLFDSSSEFSNTSHTSLGAIEESPECSPTAANIATRRHFGGVRFTYGLAGAPRAREGADDAKPDNQLPQLEEELSLQTIAQVTRTKSIQDLHSNLFGMQGEEPALPSVLSPLASARSSISQGYLPLSVRNAPQFMQSLPPLQSDNPNDALPEDPEGAVAVAAEEEIPKVFLQTSLVYPDHMLSCTYSSVDFSLGMKSSYSRVSMDPRMHSQVVDKLPAGLADVDVEALVALAPDTSLNATDAFVDFSRAASAAPCNSDSPHTTDGKSTALLFPSLRSSSSSSSLVPHPAPARHMPLSARAAAPTSSVPPFSLFSKASSVPTHGLSFSAPPPAPVPPRCTTAAPALALAPSDAHMVMLPTSTPEIPEPFAIAAQPSTITGTVAGVDTTTELDGTVELSSAHDASIGVPSAMFVAGVAVPAAATGAGGNAEAPRQTLDTGGVADADADLLSFSSASAVSAMDAADVSVSNHDAAALSSLPNSPFALHVSYAASHGPMHPYTAFTSPGQRPSASPAHAHAAYASSAASSAPPLSECVSAHAPERDESLPCLPTATVADLSFANASLGGHHLSCSGRDTSADLSLSVDAAAVHASMNLSHTISLHSPTKPVPAHAHAGKTQNPESGASSESHSALSSSFMQVLGAWSPEERVLMRQSEEELAVSLRKCTAATQQLQRVLNATTEDLIAAQRAAPACAPIADSANYAPAPAATPASSSTNTHVSPAAAAAVVAPCASPSPGVSVPSLLDGEALYHEPEALEDASFAAMSPLPRAAHARLAGNATKASVTAVTPASKRGTRSATAKYSFTPLATKHTHVHVHLHTASNNAAVAASSSTAPASAEPQSQTATTAALNTGDISFSDLAHISVVHTPAKGDAADHNDDHSRNDSPLAALPPLALPRTPARECDGNTTSGAVVSEIAGAVDTNTNTETPAPTTTVTTPAVPAAAPLNMSTLSAFDARVIDQFTAVMNQSQQSSVSLAEAAVDPTNTTGLNTTVPLANTSTAPAARKRRVSAVHASIVNTLDKFAELTVLNSTTNTTANITALPRADVDPDQTLLSPSTSLNPLVLLSPIPKHTHAALLSPFPHTHTHGNVSFALPPSASVTASGDGLPRIHYRAGQTPADVTEAHDGVSRPSARALFASPNVTAHNTSARYAFTSPDITALGLGQSVAAASPVPLEARVMDTFASLAQSSSFAHMGGVMDTSTSVAAGDTTYSAYTGHGNTMAADKDTTLTAALDLLMTVGDAVPACADLTPFRAPPTAASAMPAAAHAASVNALSAPGTAGDDADAHTDVKASAPTAVAPVPPATSETCSASTSSTLAKAFRALVTLLFLAALAAALACTNPLSLTLPGPAPSLHPPHTHTHAHASYSQSTASPAVVTGPLQPPAASLATEKAPLDVLHLAPASADIISIPTSTPTLTTPVTTTTDATSTPDIAIPEATRSSPLSTATPTPAAPAAALDALQVVEAVLSRAQTHRSEAVLFTSSLHDERAAVAQEEQHTDVREYAVGAETVTTSTAAAAEDDNALFAAEMQVHTDAPVIAPHTESPASNVPGSDVEIEVVATAGAEAEVEVQVGAFADIHADTLVDDITDDSLAAVLDIDPLFSTNDAAANDAIAASLTTSAAPALATDDHSSAASVLDIDCTIATDADDQVHLSSPAAGVTLSHAVDLSVDAPTTASFAAPAVVDTTKEVVEVAVFDATNNVAATTSPTEVSDVTVPLTTASPASLLSASATSSPSRRVRAVLAEVDALLSHVPATRVSPTTTTTVAAGTASTPVSGTAVATPIVDTVTATAAAAAAATAKAANTVSVAAADMVDSMFNALSSLAPSTSYTPIGAATITPPAAAPVLSASSTTATATSAVSSTVLAVVALVVGLAAAVGPTLWGAVRGAGQQVAGGMKANTPPSPMLYDVEGFSPEKNRLRSPLLRIEAEQLTGARLQRRK